MARCANSGPCCSDLKYLNQKYLKYIIYNQKVGTNVGKVTFKLQPPMTTFDPPPPPLKAQIEHTVEERGVPQLSVRVPKKYHGATSNLLVADLKTSSYIFGFRL
jgi:hypothetical protein